MSTIDTPGGFIRTASGTEGRVCADLARRQAMGIAKYQTTVEANPLALYQWVTHLYEELLDASVYAKRILEELERVKDDGK